MQLIILLINGLFTASVLTHGDHTKDLFTGEEILTNYDQVKEDAFQKVSENNMIGSISFKKR